MQDKCAVVAFFQGRDASFALYDALHMQNSRGPQASGMVVVQERTFAERKGLGLVPEVYSANVLQQLRGQHGIGHNRYATKGPNNVRNIQPWVITAKNGTRFAVASNGDLPWYDQMRLQLVAEEYGVESDNDGELIGWFIAWGLDQGFTMVDAMRYAMRELQCGSFSCVVCTEDAVYTMRDPRGFRPLAYAKCGDAYVVASETVAFDILQATYIRDVEPGTIICIDSSGERTYPCLTLPHAHCEFEIIYFARPDSKVFGIPVSLVRKQLGRMLAKAYTFDADLVIGVPDSGEHGALGFHETSGLPYDKGLIRHHFSRRQFLQDSQNQRNEESKYKHNPDRAVVDGKRIVVVDDSIVRGTASRKIIRMLRNAGAREVHYRVTSPPIIGPCFFGIDTPTLEELIANKRSVDEIRTFIEADSLHYLTLDQLHDCIPNPKRDYCSACFTRKYPVPLPPDKQYAMLPV